MKNRKAGFWLRVAALSLDELILVPSVLLLLFAVQSRTGWLISRHIPQALLFYEAVDYNYYTLFWLFFGQTPGKMVMRTKLVKMDGSGLTYRDVCIRYWTWMLGVACLGVGYFWIAFHKNKQGWNDLAAKTYVVRL